METVKKSRAKITSSYSRQIEFASAFETELIWVSLV